MFCNIKYAHKALTKCNKITSIYAKIDLKMENT